MVLKKGKLNILIIVAYYIIGVLLLISIFASHFRPTTNSFIAITALFFPLLWIIELLLLIVFLFKRNYKLVLLSVILLLLSSYQVSLILNFSNSKSPKSNQNLIRLVSYNAGNADTINPYVKRQQTFDNYIFHNADIVCLQEFIPTDDSAIESLEIFQNKLTVDYYGIVNGDSSGLSIYTNYEILDFGFLKQAGEDTYAVWCLMKVEKDTINIINVQLQSIRLEDDELESMTSLKSIINLPVKMTSIYSKLKRGFEWREEQVEKLNQLITYSNYPVILCGDFNDTPSSFTYREISKLLDDAFLEKGNGFSFTYAGNLPFLRIDYVMVSDELKINSYTLIDETFSDHYPVSVEVKFSTSAKATVDK